MALAIADTAVFFAQDDHADAAWTTQMVTMIREERELDTANRYGELNLIGVRARFPDYALATSESRHRYSEFQAKYIGADFEQWVSLESEPRVESNQIEQPIPLDEPFDEISLVKGYAQLLAVALGEDPAAGEAFLRSLPEGIVRSGTRAQFFLLEEQGILLNPADEERNVSFRVETFCGLLDDLHRETALVERTSPGLAAAGLSPVRIASPNRWMRRSLKMMTPPGSEAGASSTRGSASEASRRSGLSSAHRAMRRAAQSRWPAISWPPIASAATTTSHEISARCSRATSREC